MAASFQLRVLCCVIGSALLVSRIEAQCGGGPDAQAEAGENRELLAADERSKKRVGWMQRYQL